MAYTIGVNTGALHAASYAPLIPPGSFVAIYGQNLADGAALCDSASTAVLVDIDVVRNHGTATATG
jgi:hypothetical protein